MGGSTCIQCGDGGNVVCITAVFPCFPLGSSRMAVCSDSYSSSWPARTQPHDMGPPRSHMHTGAAQVLPSNSDAFSDALSEEIQPYDAQTPGQPHQRNHRSKTKSKQKKVPSKPVQASDALATSESSKFLSEDLSHRRLRSVNHSSGFVEENLTQQSERSFDSHSSSTIGGLNEQPNWPGELEGTPPALAIAPKKRKGLSIPISPTAHIM